MAHRGTVLRFRHRYERADQRYVFNVPDPSNHGHWMSKNGGSAGSAGGSHRSGEDQGTHPGGTPARLARRGQTQHDVYDAGAKAARARANGGNPAPHDAAVTRGQRQIVGITRESMEHPIPAHAPAPSRNSPASADHSTPTALSKVTAPDLARNGGKTIEGAPGSRAAMRAPVNTRPASAAKALEGERPAPAPKPAGGQRSGGKALEATTPRAGTKAAETTDGVVHQIPMSQLHVGLNPREHFGEKDLHDLTAAIKEHGLLQPISIRPHEGTYQIIAGERRFRAMQAVHDLNHTPEAQRTIPALIHHVTEDQARELALIENVSRADMRPVETARAYASLRDRGLSPKEIGAKVGKSPETIKDSLALLDLHPHVQNAIDDKRLPQSLVPRLAKLSQKGQADATEAILSQHVTGAKARAIISWHYGRESQQTMFGAPEVSKGAKEAHDAYTERMRQLTSALHGLDDKTLERMMPAVGSPHQQAQLLTAAIKQLERMRTMLLVHAAGRDLSATQTTAASEHAADIFSLRERMARRPAAYRAFADALTTTLDAARTYRRYVFNVPDPSNKGHWMSKHGGSASFEGGHAMEHPLSNGGRLHVEAERDAGGKATGRYHVGTIRPGGGKVERVGTRPQSLDEVNRLVTRFDMKPLTAQHFQSARQGQRATSPSASHDEQARALDMARTHAESYRGLLGPDHVRTRAAEAEVARYERGDFGPPKLSKAPKGETLPARLDRLQQDYHQHQSWLSNQPFRGYDATHLTPAERMVRGRVEQLAARIEPLNVRVTAIKDAAALKALKGNEAYQQLHDNHLVTLVQHPHGEFVVVPSEHQNGTMKLEIHRRSDLEQPLASYQHGRTPSQTVHPTVQQLGKAMGEWKVTHTFSNLNEATRALQADRKARETLAKTDTATLHQAYRDWVGRRAYLDNGGNYRIRDSATGKSAVAPWNRSIKAAYGGRLAGPMGRDAFSTDARAHLATQVAEPTA